jgi:hypothetical protein
VERNLRISLIEEDAEAEDIARLTGYLREELLQLDVDDVTAVPGRELPPGARAAGITEIGELLVALGGSVNALSQVVTVMRAWLGRSHDSNPSLRLEIDGDAIEVSKATDEQVTDAFRIFVEQHSSAGARQ